MTRIRNPWPWGLGMFITAFACSMVAFVVWSLRHKQDLVAPDYYEQELHHQAVIEQHQRAKAAGLSPLEFEPNANVINLSLPPDSREVRVTLYRPSDAALDRSQDVVLDERGRAEVSLAGLAAGLWRARVEWSQAGARARSEVALVIQ